MFWTWAITIGAEVNSSPNVFFIKFSFFNLFGIHNFRVKFLNFFYVTYCIVSFVVLPFQQVWFGSKIIWTDSVLFKILYTLLFLFFFNRIENTCLAVITDCNLIVGKIWSIPCYPRSTLFCNLFVAAKKQIYNSFSLQEENLLLTQIYLSSRLEWNVCSIKKNI